MKMFKNLMPIAAALLLGACAGFEPLYGQNTAVRTNLEQLSLVPIEGRAGFLFAQALQERGGIQTGESKPYLLEVDLRKRQTNIGVRIDDVSTRARLTVFARYTIHDRNGKIIHKGNVEGQASFDQPDEPYAALAAEQDAESRAITVLSEKTMTDLAVFFASAPDGP